MTRAEVRTFLEDGVNEITPVPVFDSGLYTFFNSNRTWDYSNGVVFQETAPVDTDLPNSAPVDSWQIILWISKLTSMDATPAEYEPLIDDMDLLAQKLIYKYRVVVSGFKDVQIEGISREPFVKENADILAGVKLTFVLKVQNKTNVC